MHTIRETSKTPRADAYRTGWQMLLLDVLFVTLIMQRLG